MGLYVIAVDGNPEAAGLRLADQGVVMNLRDVVSVIRLAKEADIACVLPVPLGAILTTVGAVNDALGLRGISQIAAQRCTDKLLMRRVLAAAGLPAPRFQEAGDADSIEAAAIALNFPVVTKPRYGSGSRGIFVARDRAELRQWLPWHLEQRHQTRQETSIVEQFIPGVEIGVDGVAVENRFSVVLVRDKEVTPLPFRLPYAHLVPSSLVHIYGDRLTKVLETAAAALGLQNCLLHADILVSSSNELVILDISGRPSGFNISARLLPAATGIELTHQAIQLALGQSACFEPKQQRGAVLRMLTAPVGVFRGVEGLATVAQMPGVVAVESFLQAGDRISERRTGASGYRVGYLISSGETREEAEAIWRQAAGQLRFLVDESPGGAIAPQF